MEEAPNLDYIKALSDGDKIFEKKIIDIIKKEFIIEKNIYLKNSKSDNYILIAENVHKLKHKISILGLVKSYEIAVEYENNLREKDFTLRSEFQTILNSMAHFLKTI